MSQRTQGMYLELFANFALLLAAKNEFSSSLRNLRSREKATELAIRNYSVAMLRVNAYQF